jgi:hypothetical protein
LKMFATPNKDLPIEKQGSALPYTSTFRNPLSPPNHPEHIPSPANPSNATRKAERIQLTCVTEVKLPLLPVCSARIVPPLATNAYTKSPDIAFVLITESPNLNSRTSVHHINCLLKLFFIFNPGNHGKHRPLW